MDLSKPAGAIGARRVQGLSRPKRGDKVRLAISTPDLAPRVEPLEGRAYLTATIALAPAMDYPGVTAPAGMAEADYNANGVADIALVGINPDTNLPSVGVYLDGAAPVFYDLPGAISAQDIVTADFNGDGNVDLAVTDPVGGTVNVLLGNGDGTFQTPITTSYGTAQPTGTIATAYLASADFNGDGIPDLAVADPADEQISILLGAGAGAFTLGTPITSGESSFDPQRIVTADFNGDTAPDLAYNDGTSAQLDVAMGDNAGNFAAPTPFALDGAVQGIATGDMNGDGQPDIIASVSTAGGNGAVDVLLNAGATFTAAASSPTTFADPGPIAVGDINDDGLSDIVTLNSTGALDLLVGDGDGTFQPAIESQATTSGTPQAVLTTDVNGDGEADILFSETNPTITGGGGFGLVIGAKAPEVSVGITGSLPATAISGGKTPITQTLTLTNTSGATVSGTVSVNVALSTDPTFSSDDTPLDSLTIKGKVKCRQAQEQKSDHRQNTRRPYCGKLLRRCRSDGSVRRHHDERFDRHDRYPGAADRPVRLF
ncbi:MAG TPA: VCBS repeat-containing protein [Tepidisphaeraceae bacterium]|jgi:hypothetical protein|nr:VCBS repeat-containing protein [Tepidisphaeraceae bacterium]